MKEEFKQKFYEITDLIQQEFDRNLGIYGDKIKCSRGCNKCCSQIFRITKLDGWIISEHVKTLPKKQKQDLQNKAEEYLEQLKKSKKDKSERGNFNPPCPALGNEGECTIYNARPVICRRFGMPIYDYKDPGKLYACELNFNDGDELTDELLILNQTNIGKKWDALKDDFEGGSTTIAEAIANS
ncbi:MAG: YkgJ family cysteine cluster protein [Ignavibacteria bacterium]|nr:YkgJ family cysteine cluster protein [Ignavibacteria bacterium]